MRLQDYIVLNLDGVPTGHYVVNTTSKEKAERLARNSPSVTNYGNIVACEPCGIPENITDCVMSNTSVKAIVRPKGEGITMRELEALERIS